MNHIKLFEGCYYFQNSLSMEDKSYLLNLYYENKNKLYTPKLSSNKSMSLQMTCFGMHWNPKTYDYSEYRDDFDKEKVESYPEKLNEIAEKFLLPFENKYKPDWNIAIMNFYSQISKLGMHQDNSESNETIKIGHPIVSFSIGQKALFRIGGFKRDDLYKDIWLNSGDVIIFGGESRLRYHSIVGLSPENYELDFLNGRINFTLRKF